MPIKKSVNRFIIVSGLGQPYAPPEGGDKVAGLNTCFSHRLRAVC